MTCTHRLWDADDGLPCTRTDRHDRGHVYASSSGNDMGEGPRHGKEPDGE
jgi:hypothetical protein